jgi:hypothetical protein
MVPAAVTSHHSQAPTALISHRTGTSRSHQVNHGTSRSHQSSFTGTSVALISHHSQAPAAVTSQSYDQK